ncbi:hypothetical protein ABKN59_009768 [Abortiporus biennis]
MVNNEHHWGHLKPLATLNTLSRRASSVRKHRAHDTVNRAEYPSPDIIRHILRFVRDEPSTLARCCLVNRTWLNEARHFLYAEVQLSVDARPGKSDTSFVSAVERLENQPGVWKHIQVLVLRGRSVGETNPDSNSDSMKRIKLCSHLLIRILQLLPSLRRLRIENCRFVHKYQGSTQKRLLQSFLYPSSFTNHHESHLLHSNSHNCIFESTTDIPLPESPADQIIIIPPKRDFPVSLDYLSLGHIGAEGDPSSVIEEVLSLFSGYTTFESYGVVYHPGIGTYPVVITKTASAGTGTNGSSFSLTSVHRGTESHCPEQALLSQLIPRWDALSLRFSGQGPPSLSNLRELCVGLKSWKEFHAMSAILLEYGSQLRYLDINPGKMFHAGEVTEPIDWRTSNISSCISLEEICLAIDFFNETYGDHPKSSSHLRKNIALLSSSSVQLLCQYPIDILQSLPTSTLKQITIRVRLHPDPEVGDAGKFVETFNWEKFQTELLRIKESQYNQGMSESSSLTNVRFERYSLGSSSLKPCAIEKRLKVLEDYKMLEVVDIQSH